MEFKFETAYNQEAVTVMAKALRKTIRKKQNCCARILSGILVACAILVTLPFWDSSFVVDFRTVFTWLISAILLLILIFEDKIHGYIAWKRMMPGLDKAVVTFSEEGYLSETPIGKSEFKYDSIQMLAETKDYFIFVFSRIHAQLYDKTSISGGTIEEFRDFIKGVTGKEIQMI